MPGKELSTTTAPAVAQDITPTDATKELKRLMGWTPKTVQLVIATSVPEGTPPYEVLRFAYACRRTGLDPIARQIYLVKYGSKFVNQTGIDGFRLTAARTRQAAGVDEPEFEQEQRETVALCSFDRNSNTWAVTGAENILRPSKCRVKVYRKMEDGTVATFVGVARWEEFARYDKRTIVGEEGKTKVVKALRDMWAAMPFNQLAKCAEAQAWRKGFPAELGDIFTDGEMGMVIDVVGTPVDQRPLNIPQRASESVGSAARGGSIAEELWNKLMDATGGNAEEAGRRLEKLTAFEKDGKSIPGVRDWKKLTDGRAKTTLNILERQSSQRA